MKYNIDPLNDILKDVEHAIVPPNIKIIRETPVMAVNTFNLPPLPQLVAEKQLLDGIKFSAAKSEFSHK